MREKIALAGLAEKNPNNHFNLWQNKLEKLNKN